MTKQEISILNKQLAKTFIVDLTKERINCNVNLAKAERYLLSTYKYGSNNYDAKYFIIHQFNHYMYKDIFLVIELLHKDLLQFIKILPETV